ncbi:hypothetical protein AB205_0208970, partial [Aquarana catesbeiana]
GVAGGVSYAFANRCPSFLSQKAGRYADNNNNNNNNRNNLLSLEQALDFRPGMDPSHRESAQLCSGSSYGRPSSMCQCPGLSAKKRCCEGLKIFLAAMCFVYFAKALSGSYLKSTITQIEKRFEIPSSLVGIIDGSFEIGCDGDLASTMWLCVLLGNLLRGVGEAPIQPLGISYIDDYAREDNTAFYIDQVPITPQDSRWVGAWWLGYLVAGAISLFATIPFWFLPKEQPRPDLRKNSSTPSEQSKFILEDLKDPKIEGQLLRMSKDFLPSLKDLLGNPVFFLYLCGSVFQFNSLVGMVTYKPKYIEQQYGQTSTQTNLIIGLINIPAVALGIFSGGLIMKKFRINILGAAKLLLISAVIGYLMLMTLFVLGCERSTVAGLTFSYEG